MSVLKSCLASAKCVSLSVVLGAFALTGQAMAGTTFTGEYVIESLHSGKVLDVAGWSRQSGGNIIQWPYRAGKNQHWVVEPAGNDHFYIKNVHSGLYMDVAGGAVSNGTNIQQWQFNGSNAQRFRIIEVAAGAYRIQSIASGKVIDVSGVSRADGANIHQWDYVGGNNQKWHFVPVGAERDAKGSVYFTSVHSNKALDVAEVSRAEGATVQQWGYGGGANQHWNLINTSTGYYKLQASHSDQLLDVAWASTANGANIQQAIENGSDAQWFALIDAGNGEYVLRNKHSGKVLDVSGWSTRNGANVVQWGYHGGANQKWRMHAVNSNPPGTCQDTPVWSDEFNYNGLPDPGKWSFEVHGPGWVNNEWQNYTDRRLENARVENGRLIIEARRDWFGGHEISSARIRTAGKGDWLNGRIEVRAKLPRGRGTWPAIWMLPTDWVYGDWPNSGEIDIMENVGYDPASIHGSIHSHGRNHMLGNNFQVTTYDGSVQDQFHTYGIDWNQDRIEFYMDGKHYGTYTNPRSGWSHWPFDKRFHMILNLAIGGMWGGAQGVDMGIFPARMEVDYVRVYKQGACR